MASDHELSRPAGADGGDARRPLGAAGERIAARHLEQRGMTVIARNFRTRFGELDIIACDARHIVFCEVKTRRAGRSARDPLESVHPRKRAQVRRMAGQWLAHTPERPRVAELRFDVIGILLDAEDELVALEHIEAAF